MLLFIKALQIFFSAWNEVHQILFHQRRSLTQSGRTLQWRTQKIFMGGFIQWHVVVICIWCALFVTSQIDVIFMFPNQRFGEVC